VSCGCALHGTARHCTARPRGRDQPIDAGLGRISHANYFIIHPFTKMQYCRVSARGLRLLLLHKCNNRCFDRPRPFCSLNGVILQSNRLLALVGVSILKERKVAVDVRQLKKGGHAKCSSSVRVGIIHGETLYNNFYKARCSKKWDGWTVVSSQRDQTVFHMG
jgi:hypothetical protein